MIITERKQAEEALRESEERYRVVVEDQTEMISRYLPNGTLTFVNDAFCRHINRQRENLLGQSWWTLLVSEEELERVQKHITSLSRKNPVISFESQVVAPDGKSLRWEQWTNRALFDEQGKIVEYQGIGCDITERKQAEEERDRFFRLSLDMLCIASVDGYFKRLNPAFEETLGFATEELLSQQFIDFIHPDDVASTRAEVEKQMAGVPTINFENRYRCKDGSYKWLSWKAVAYAEEGLLYAVARDITERKQAEGQLKAALDEKEILLKEVYHRVKNNMTGLEYLIEMQAEDNESPELVNAFEELQGRVRAMGLVHQKLYQTTNLARIDFGEYLEELTAQLFNALGKNRPISLHVKAATIFVDARLAVTCGLIVNELVTNALKYAFPASFHLDEIEGGQANQEIHIAFEASEGEYILVVSDNGVGLPPELDWQATESLGMRLVTLWASYQLQGSIQVDTRNGTVFTLRFPKE